MMYVHAALVYDHNLQLISNLPEKIGGTGLTVTSALVAKLPMQRFTVTHLT